MTDDSGQLREILQSLFGKEFCDGLFFTIDLAPKLSALIGLLGQMKGLYAVLSVSVHSIVSLLKGG